MGEPIEEGKPPGFEPAEPVSPVLIDKFNLIVSNLKLGKVFVVLFRL
jgi:hypothetical protein